MNIKPLLREELKAPKQEYVNWRWAELKPERRRKFKEPKITRSHKVPSPKCEAPKQENIRLAKCATCNGAGEIPKKYTTRCKFCSGTGKLWSGGGIPADPTWGSDFVKATCEPCSYCRFGYVQDERKIECPECKGLKVVIVRG